MYAVVDFEGFQLKPGCFVIKEFAFWGINDDKFGHWMFEPPVPWKKLTNCQKKTCSWLTRNLHNISWDFGDIPYMKFQSILCSLVQSYSTIFVKGLEKKCFLQKLTRQSFYNLEDIQCPNFKDLHSHNISCFYHDRHSSHCALMKAAAFKKYINHLFQNNMLHSSSLCGQNNTSNI